jgi:hypothetical protein
MWLKGTAFPVGLCDPRVEGVSGPNGPRLEFY